MPQSVQELCRIWLMLKAELYYPNQSPSESLPDVYHTVFLSGSHVR